MFGELTTAPGSGRFAAPGGDSRPSDLVKARSVPARAARPVDKLTIGRVTVCSSNAFPGRRAAVLSFESRSVGSGGISWPTALSYAAENRSVINAVLFAGADPLEHREIRVAAIQGREHGFQVGVETSGLYPERLRSVRREAAWVRLHMNAPLERVDHATGTPRSVARVLASICTLVTSGLAYECCTTWDPSVISRDDLNQIADDLAKLGVRCWRIRGVPQGALPVAHARALGSRFESFSADCED